MQFWGEKIKIYLYKDYKRKSLKINEKLGGISIISEIDADR